MIDSSIVMKGYIKKALTKIEKEIDDDFSYISNGIILDKDRVHYSNIEDLKEFLVDSMGELLQVVSTAAKEMVDINVRNGKGDDYHFGYKEGLEDLSNILEELTQQDD